MKASIGIVDYGLGNIKSIMNACVEIGSRAALVSDPDQIHEFDKIIFPGVGAFGSAMEKLNSGGMRDALQEMKNSGRMILGICLGMQLMCLTSEESVNHDGLGWFDAEVVQIPVDQPGLKIPHIGWNSIRIQREKGLLNDIQDLSDVYFVHSYMVQCHNKEDILATCEYGKEFVAVFGKGNCYGIQFHPEKSQWVGLNILSNFVRL